MVIDMQKHRRWKYVTDDGEELFFKSQEDLLRYKRMVAAVEDMEDRAERESMNHGSPFRD